MTHRLPPSESLTVEFKSDRKRLPDGELVEAIVGLANTEGGELWLGVEDDGTPTGLHPEHALLAGLPGPATALGLGEAAASARLKLMASVPAPWRDQAAVVAERLHIDPLDWYRTSDTPAFLREAAQAVWSGKRLRVDYMSWRGLSRRELEPLGLVLKAGGGGAVFVGEQARFRVRLESVGSPHHAVGLGWPVEGDEGLPGQHVKIALQAFQGRFRGGGHCNVVGYARGQVWGRERQGQRAEQCTAECTTEPRTGPMDFLFHACLLGIRLARRQNAGPSRTLQLRPPGTVSSVDKETCAQGTGHRSNRASSNSERHHPPSIHDILCVGAGLPAKGLEPCTALGNAIAGKPALTGDTEQCPTYVGAGLPAKGP